MQQAGHFSALDQAVIATVCYFDVFDYPVTLFELHQWLYAPDIAKASYAEVMAAASQLVVAGYLVCHHGFYSRPNRTELITIRQQHYRIADYKYRLAVRVTRWLRWIGSVQSVIVCNTVGLSNPTIASDIDVCIIAKAGRLWWTRLWVIGITTILGVRLSGPVKKNRICLSFYVSDAGVSLESVQAEKPDVHLAYWLASTFVPVYGQSVYVRFMQSNNWINKYLPNRQVYKTALRRHITSGCCLESIRWFQQQWVFNWLELLVRRLQHFLLSPAITTAATKNNTDVIMSEDMLKLHVVDRRRPYNQQWREACKQAML